MLQRTLRTKQNTLHLNYIYFCWFLVVSFPPPSFSLLSSYLSFSSWILLNLHHPDVDLFMPWGSCCGRGSRKTADTRITTGNFSFLLQQDRMAAFKHLNAISPHPLQPHEIFIPRFSFNTENLCCSLYLCWEAEQMETFFLTSALCAFWFVFVQFWMTNRLFVIRADLDNGNVLVSASNQFKWDYFNPAMLTPKKSTFVKRAKMCFYLWTN